MKKVLSVSLMLLSLLPMNNGDMNRDGRLSTTDLVLLRQAIGGNDMRADLNFDGIVDEYDLQAMRVKLSEGKENAN